LSWSLFQVRLRANRLRATMAIFPDGVCDWNAQGIEQQAPNGVRQRF